MKNKVQLKNYFAELYGIFLEQFYSVQIWEYLSAPGPPLYVIVMVLDVVSELIIYNTYDIIYDTSNIQFFL